MPVSFGEISNQKFFSLFSTQRFTMRVEGSRINGPMPFFLSTQDNATITSSMHSEFVFIFSVIFHSFHERVFVTLL